MRKKAWPGFLIAASIIVLSFFVGRSFKRLKAAIIPPMGKDQFILKKWASQCKDIYWAGDLWIYASDQRKLKQVTKSLCVGKILEMSTNKKQVLVTIEGWDQKSRTTSLGVVELATGQMKILKFEPQYNNYGIGYWLSDNKVVNFIPTEDSTEIKIEAINIENKEAEIIGAWPFGVLSIGGFDNQRFSDDRQWAVGNDYRMDERAPFTVKLFSYDLKSKTKYPIIQGKYVKFITWLGNKIIYLDKINKRNILLAIDADGSNKEKLGDLGEKGLNSFAVSGDKTKLIYATVTEKTNTPEIDVNHEWFNFDLVSKENRKLDFTDNFVELQSVSRDGKLGIFLKKDNHELFMVDLNSLIEVRICGAGNGCEVAWPN